MRCVQVDNGNSNSKFVLKSQFSLFSFVMVSTFSKTALVEQFLFITKTTRILLLPKYFCLKETFKNSTISQKISFKETKKIKMCLLPSAFWGNRIRMFRPPGFLICIFSCRAWLLDKSELVNIPIGNLDRSCQRYGCKSVALGLLSVSVLDMHTRHWEPLVSCLAGFALGHNRPFYLVTLMCVCVCLREREWVRKTESKGEGDS